MQAIVAGAPFVPCLLAPVSPFCSVSLRCDSSPDIRFVRGPGVEFLKGSLGDLQRHGGRGEDRRRRVRRHGACEDPHATQSHRTPARCALTPGQHAQIVVCAAKNLSRPPVTRLTAARMRARADHSHGPDHARRGDRVLDSGARADSSDAALDLRDVCLRDGKSASPRLPSCPCTGACEG